MDVEASVRAWASDREAIQEHRIGFTTQACVGTGLPAREAALLTRFALVLCAVADARPSQAPDAWERLLHDELVEVFGELGDCPGAGRQLPFLRRRFELMVGAVRLEREWSSAWQAGGGLPGYENYLANGAESSSMPTLLAALLVLADVRLKAGRGVEELLTQAGWACRLAADLQPDRAGKLSSVTILVHSGRTRPEAVSQVELEATRAAGQAWRLAQALPGGLAAWGAGAVQLTGASLAFHLRRGSDDRGGLDLKEG